MPKNYVGSPEITGSYAIYAGNYDWGASVEKMVLSLNAPIDEVSAGDFKVQTEKDNNVYMVGKVHQVEELKVVNAYLCNEQGDPTDKASPYVALEIEVGPDKASPFLVSEAAMMNIYARPYTCNITLTEEADWTSKGIGVTSFEVDPNAVTMTTDADVFALDTYTTSSGVTYDYAAYTPDQKSDTLVVWLHGLCEGKTLLKEGEETDPYITCMSAEVTALAGEEFQSIIGGANVLVPQCPSYWMDADGKSSNTDGVVIHADGTSFYTESLHELIETYKKECGADKVLIAGCSNGGYMGMVMATNYTDEYDGYVLICEAMPDQFLTDQQLEASKICRCTSSTPRMILWWFPVSTRFPPLPGCAPWAHPTSTFLPPSMWWICPASMQMRTADSTSISVTIPGFTSSTMSPFVTTAARMSGTGWHSSSSKQEIPIV